MFVHNIYKDKSKSAKKKRVSSKHEHFNIVKEAWRENIKKELNNSHVLLGPEPFKLEMGWGGGMDHPTAKEAFHCRERKPEQAFE